MEHRNISQAENLLNKNSKRSIKFENTRSYNSLYKNKACFSKNATNSYVIS